MTSKHTPGPWGYHKCLCGDRGCTSFVIDHSGAEGMFDEADAKFIAAAPETAAERDRLKVINTDLWDLVEEVIPERDSLKAINAELLRELVNLLAMVEGEVPSLLEDDHAYVTITAAIAKAKEHIS